MPENGEKKMTLLLVGDMLKLCHELAAKLDDFVARNPAFINEYIIRRNSLRDEDTRWSEELKMIVNEGPSITPPTQADIDLIMDNVKGLSRRIAESKIVDDLLNVFAQVLNLFGQVRKQT
jgi:hypothetical protein